MLDEVLSLLQTIIEYHHTRNMSTEVGLAMNLQLRFVKNTLQHYAMVRSFVLRKFERTSLKALHPIARIIISLITSVHT